MRSQERPPAPYLADRDLRLYVGDARDVLRELEPASVDCVITSPPYWGLRDYGTGVWAGGNPDCEHRVRRPGDDPRQGTFRNGKDYAQGKPYRDVCGRCGATRQDQQLGLEPTPSEYVENMVAVFREVRRVLAPHGTCWINLGDSYASDPNKGGSGTPNGRNNRGENYARGKRIERGAGRWGGGNVHAPALKPKDLCGIPWRVAFALQADGWYLRSDIVWAKPNPMPESATDRPTKAHEYVFLLTKQPRYWFDQEAVREPHNDKQGLERFNGSGGSRPEYEPNHQGWVDGGGMKMRSGPREYNPAGRNLRSVWSIATQPYPEAHFATYPEELVRRCLLAGCAREVCRVCGKPRERIVETTGGTIGNSWHDHSRDSEAGQRSPNTLQNSQDRSYRREMLGWSDCGHGGNWRPGVVLDPFLGSGTTALVARRHGRHAVGIDLSEEYARLVLERTQQLSLLAEANA